MVEGVVRRVEPGRRFAYTWAWTDLEPSHETLVTLGGRAARGRGQPGRRSSTAAGPRPGVDEATRDDHEAYWSGYLDDLAAILAGTD